MNDNQLREINFSNSFVFNHVMRNPGICRRVIETLLGIRIEKIEYVETEKTVDVGVRNHGIRLDVYVKDPDKIYDIEIQNYPEPDIARRLRYYQSMIDADSLLRRRRYAELKDSFVIFLCTYDPFGRGLPCYEFRRSCVETGEVLEDGTRHFVFNAKSFAEEKRVEIKSLLEYTETGRSGSALTDDIDVIVRSLRESESFREAHVYLADELENREYAGYKRGLEQGIDQGIEQGIERGIAQGIEKGISQGIDMGISQGEHRKALDTARRMLSEKCGADLIQRVTGLSLDEINSQL